MIAFLLLSALVHAAPLKAETYFLGNSSLLSIEKAVEKQFNFRISGANSYSGHSSEVVGTAKNVSAHWEFQNPEINGCIIRFEKHEKVAIKVSLLGCPGLWVEPGVYRIRDKDCGAGFDQKKKEIIRLRRAKNYPEALDLTDALVKDCVHTLDENGQADLFNFLALSSFLNGDKKRCLDEVKRGIQAIGAHGGMKELREGLELYAEVNDRGNLSCETATNPGCRMYEERIKIFKQLDQNRDLCKK